LGIQVCSGLVKYYSQWKDYDEDVQTTLSQVQELQGIFQSCRVAVEDSDGAPVDLLDVLERQLQACAASVLRLQKYLDKIRIQCPNGAQSFIEVALSSIKRGQKQLLYPFRQGTLGKLRDVVFETKSNLMPALQALNL
jgi:hypothetical protein